MNFEILKKNKVLLILVGILLLSVGVSLAYFATKILQSGTGGSIVTTTAAIHGADIKVEGTLEFNDTDIYPGYMNVSGIKVTATGDNELIPYNLVWKGTNGISQINYKVYKTSSPVTSTSNCEKKIEVVNGIQQYSEECTISNLDKLGTAIESGSIKKNDTKVMLVKDEFITATSDGQIVYYYVVLEYPNLDINQSDDINATFDGLVTVEESDKKPDINILAVKVEQEDGTYKDSDDIPQEGYVLNTEKSTCSNGAIPKWDYEKKGLLTSNLTKSGTNCYLMFDKMINNIDMIILSLGEASGDTSRLKIGTPDFSQPATGMETEPNNGIFISSDPMYGENAKTYYWRGAATTNHVIFGGYCWRIIRINGDKTLRLIYNGPIQSNNTCKGNGEWAESNAIANQTYYDYEDHSEYVGWTHSKSYKQRPTDANDEVSSNLKVQLEKWSEDWFKDNSKISETQKTKIVSGKFCNERSTTQTWSTQPSRTFYYKAGDRLNYGVNNPTFECSIEDIYEMKIGTITADEISMAGGGYESSYQNKKFYLYNNNAYWTMSPFRSYYSSPTRTVQILLFGNSGYILHHSTKSTFGIRPVINLNSDVIFNIGSDGTNTNPYIVQ